ncbi:MAG TPA: UDP-3-O-(3-hydroxymyristoyl)glucosamine N-acyltransferase [Hypericibacter adhaerens]|uniref:UDP-3-O-acylglucosamine N-acyltransferase n=1 Tax=Hypericibacter adhaerens TaxID=2602016 RepID=A0A5J6MYQ1_9PROT|nr:UDP-3-O-(3-hydroxymyristoyl)glucosamine N-acyltransferase [Hypericibacter adhaerens]QEX21725.1 UDP-3-O-acylglucosamine N-acyltransferase [Hypericibacter adhaerens]HWA42471.1 UDP-3-O-(3-hydroxymyristoyl)glucosamine N-acyltransferase [Hypericibacter adhaerens]
MSSASRHRLDTLASRIGGRCEGDAGIEVDRPCEPADARSASDLPLLFSNDALQQLRSDLPRAALAAEGLGLPAGRFAGVIRVARPRYALARLLPLFLPPGRPSAGPHPTAIVDPSARLASDVSIGPFTQIGADVEIGAGCIIDGHVTIGDGCRLGPGCRLHAGVRLGAGTRLGARVILHFNVCLGADGFSYATPEPGSIETLAAEAKVQARNHAIERIPSLGRVVIGDDVEIGANSTVDRSTLGETLIQRGTKIDDLVMIGHNCRIGEDCLIAGQVGIAGSARIGNRVVLGGQVGIADHLTIGDDAVVMASSGVGRDVASGTVVGGTPALPRQQLFEQWVWLARLKRMAEEIRSLGERLSGLERRKDRPDE